MTDKTDMSLMGLIGAILEDKDATFSKVVQALPVRDAESAAAQTTLVVETQDLQAVPATGQNQTIAEERTKTIPSIEEFLSDRQYLSTEQIVGLLMRELRRLEGFPESGAVITVYGYRPWSAMVTFAPFVTRSEDAARFRRALPDIVAHIRHYVFHAD